MSGRPPEEQSAHRDLAQVLTSWRRAATDTLTFRTDSLRVVVTAILLVILARSAIFVFWEDSHFDANQAVIGLMAKHVAEFRALPVFMYGQNYQLAVESWLAAPLFFVAGSSVTALKLPLLAINFAVAILLIHLLVHETRLRPIAAGVATLFFVLPPPGTAARLLEPSGGTLEPLLYVLLLWLTRQRPVWCGLILGIGFLNREFTIYAFVALAILAVADRSWPIRSNLRRVSTVACVGAVVWIGGQLASKYGSAEGPGSTWADLAPRAQRVEIANRLCVDWRSVPRGYLDIARTHWPLLFGTELRPLRRFNIESDVSQGFPGAGVVLAIAMLLAVSRIGVHLFRERRWRCEYNFCAYLMLVAVLSISGYVLGRCGVISAARMRYDMLSLLGAVGLGAWYLRVESVRWLSTFWVLLVVCWAGTGALAHAQLSAEYLDAPPVGGKRRILDALEARGIRYAISYYANAYPIAFLSNERIIVASSNRVRIGLYQQQVRANRLEAVRITRARCKDGERVMAGLYFCPLSNNSPIIDP
jgi:hypothetical protein